MGIVDLRPERAARFVSLGEPRDGAGGVNSVAQTAWTELALMRLTSEAHPQASS
jgi:hypothetical protein